MSTRVRVQAWTFVDADVLERLLTAMNSTKSREEEWTVDKAAAVALSNGLEEMLERYERMAARASQPILEAREP